MKRYPGELASLVMLAGLIFGARLLEARANALRGKADDLEEPSWVPRPAAARIMSLGYNEAAADFFWADTLIYYGDGMQRRSAMPDVEPRLDVVVALDPHFRRVYWWGGYALTYRAGAATEDEFRSSVRLLERGVEVFADDWELSWLLGVRYYFDLPAADDAERQRNRETGAGYIERAMRLPGSPPDLPILAATMRTKLGQLDRAVRELREMILTTSDPAVRKQLEEKYAGLVDDEARQAVAEAAGAFEREWKATLPFAPPSLYVLIGSKPAPLDLNAITVGDTFPATPDK